MRRRKTIRKLPMVRSRWSTWATQLAARPVRWSEYSGVALILTLPRLAHTLLLIQQRWLASYVKVQPQLNLSFSSNNQWNLGNSNVYAPQMTLLNFLASANEGTRVAQPGALRAGTPKTSFINQPRVPASFARQSRPQQATTLATLNRYVSLRRRDEFTEVSRLITQHSRTQPESFAARPPMALHVTAASLVTSRQLPLEAIPETNFLKRRADHHTVPAMALPDLNVELLADQVLKQIDRRVVARRERMGQI